MEYEIRLNYVTQGYRKCETNTNVRTEKYQYQTMQIWEPASGSLTQERVKMIGAANTNKMWEQIQIQIQM